MRTTSALCAAGLVAASVLLSTVPSQAALTTRCVGEAGAVTVPGDLVVPKGESCSLEGTVVEGNVRVQVGADLVLRGGGIHGNLVAQEDAYVEAEETTIGGNVTSRGSYGVYLTDARVAGDFRSPANATRGGFLLAEGTDFSGRVLDRSGSVLLLSSAVSGVVRGEGNVATDLEDSVVEGSLTVIGSEDGSLVCDSEVYGMARFTANVGAIQIGGTEPWGPCAGSAYFGDDLEIDRNTDGVRLVDAIVRGDLSGEGNDPAPLGSGNRVRGEVSGQFADLQPAGATMSSHAHAEDRFTKTREAANQRLQVAEDKAVAAGDANL